MLRADCGRTKGVLAFEQGNLDSGLGTCHLLDVWANQLHVLSICVICKAGQTKGNFVKPVCESERGE